MKAKFLALVLFVCVSTGVSATETDPAKEAKARNTELVERVHEIRKMNFSEMDREEKKLIKEELKMIKSELKSEDARGGLDDKVSISLGAIIIIILLLIIL